MIIKKRISFDFLGEEYKDAYGVFASIPVSEYPEISKTIDKEPDTVKASQQMHDLVKNKFLEGKFPDESGQLQDLKKEEIQFDADLLLAVYNRLMGNTGDPKALPPSESS